MSPVRHREHASAPTPGTAPLKSPRNSVISEISTSLPPKRALHQRHHAGPHEPRRQSCIQPAPSGKNRQPGAKARSLPPGAVNKRQPGGCRRRTHHKAALQTQGNQNPTCQLTMVPKAISVSGAVRTRAYPNPRIVANGSCSSAAYAGDKRIRPVQAETVARVHHHCRCY